MVTFIFTTMRMRARKIAALALTMTASIVQFGCADPVPPCNGGDSHGGRVFLANNTSVTNQNQAWHFRAKRTDNNGTFFIFAGGTSWNTSSQNVYAGFWSVYANGNNNQPVSSEQLTNTQWTGGTQTPGSWFTYDRACTYDTNPW